MAKYTNKHRVAVVGAFLVLIIIIGTWGVWFSPFDLATCTARGGRVVGDYGSGDV
jgi:hypothetical protein